MTYTREKNQRADIQWDENGQPLSTVFDDVYFSKSGGLDETRYVFIQGNHLPERAAKLSSDQRFTIAETGFGTGLNFLSTWQLWRQKNLSPQLHFISVEKYPLSRADLARALELWPELKELSDILLKHYPPQPCSGLHRLIFDGGKIQLTLFFGEAQEGFEQICTRKKSLRDDTTLNLSLGSHAAYVDAWFLDGFAPAKNPDMWSPKLFDVIARLSRKASTFATFTAASKVRKQLNAVGFSCEKIKGFGRKREMLVGAFDTAPKPSLDKSDETIENKKPGSQARSQLFWHLQESRSACDIPKSCIIIGAGLAGCHTARALAERGIQVMLLEKQSAIAQGASGNDQGIVYAKLSPFQDPLSQFNLSSLVFANNYYHARDYYRRCGNACGILFLAHTHKQKNLYQQFAEQFAGENFAQFLTAAECRSVSGVRSSSEALFLPKSGWLQPAQLCELLTQHANIKIKLDSQVKRLEKSDNGWQALDDDNTVLANADAAVICCANDAKALSLSAHLPLKPIRGQVTSIPSSSHLADLNTVICSEGYIAPAHEGCHTLGASYNLGDTSTQLSKQDQADNLEKIKALSPDFSSLDFANDEASGRVSFRCTTPDYFPIVGPLPDKDAMLDRFGILRKKAKSKIDAAGIYHPHLYCHLGLGSRGLCYSPLAAEVLASIITADVLPVSEDLYRFLHPARFLIRDLIRNKI